LILYQIN